MAMTILSLWGGVGVSGRGAAGLGLGLPGTGAGPGLVVGAGTGSGVGAAADCRWYPTALSAPRACFVSLRLQSRRLRSGGV